MRFSRWTSALFLAAGSALAAEPWFTVVGDDTNPNVDTVQFDPTPVSVNGHLRVLRMRASRSADRLSGEGIRFRSYNGMVEFDCDLRTARFVRSEFYLEPFWKGEPYRTFDYGPETNRAMRFYGIQPNPAERILRAACLPAAR